MRIYLYTFFIFVLVLVAHILGNNYGLYLKITGYDIFMHILGGVGMGLFAAAYLKNHFKELKNPRAVMVMFVVIAGAVWELFEAYNNIAGAPVGSTAYYIDTIKDLIDDTFGAFVAIWIIKRL